MIVVLLGYLGLSALLIASMLGPLIAGRMLADRDAGLDPETLAIEAEALARLAGPAARQPRQLPPAS